MTDSVKYTRARVREGKVSVATKIGQGIGALPGVYKDFAFNTLLLLYYSQILGLPALSASAVIAVALIVDAVTDPLVGSLSDNMHSPLGRRHLLMYGSAIPLGLSMYFLFASAHATKRGCAFSAIRCCSSG